MTKDVRKIKTERDIQTAFLELLTTRPFTKVTVSDICQKSLTSRSTFYSHYLDKYDLLDRIVTYYQTMLVQQLDQNFNQMVAGDLESLIHKVIIAMTPHRRAIQILFTVHEPHVDLKESFRQLLHTEWRHYIQKQGPIHEVPVELIADMGTSMHMTLIEWVITHGTDSLPAVIESISIIRKAILLQIDESQPSP